ncbi:hypothetical protein CVIRNUC_007121 [Coccomyxa viridis]|uniref:WW domain-containing protein n=1 Tax=Coccomyxa viridis TaxID=1274662 RepID=A0AAV1IB18_9CHLO|nr:hypothetical protein CVIRNUC_007121 [Coccomyxa viridis]
MLTRTSGKLDGAPRVLRGVPRAVSHRVTVSQVQGSVPDTLIGYSVRALPRKLFIGRVDQVRPTDEEGISPPNLLVINEAPGRGYGTERHFIPYVPQIVQQVNDIERELLVKAPTGLLSLGREKAALAYVEPLLRAFMQQQQTPEGAAHGAPMPTRSELLAAGQQHLVRAIQHAGGFLTVAQLLGLRCKRRPPGYWDSPDVLDEEISQFVAANWVDLQDFETGSNYFYNQITHRTQFDKPVQPQKIALDDEGSFMLVEDESDRVMPPRRAVMAAGRYDLHHAIQYHGGYRMAAEMLERPSAWPHFRHLREDPLALEAALRAFSRAQGGPEKHMPLIAELEAAGREDLTKVIHAAGGSHAVAAALGWRTQRRQRHSSAGLQAAAELVREYLAGLPAGERESMPVHRKLMARGRHDIRYALQVHGSAAIAELLGLPVPKRGRRSEVRVQK